MEKGKAAFPKRNCFRNCIVLLAHCEQAHLDVDADAFIFRKEENETLQVFTNMIGRK